MYELLDGSEARGLRDMQDYGRFELCRQRYRRKTGGGLACVGLQSDFSKNKLAAQTLVEQGGISVHLCVTVTPL